MSIRAQGGRAWLAGGLVVALGAVLGGCGVANANGHGLPKADPPASSTPPVVTTPSMSTTPTTAPSTPAGPTTPAGTTSPTSPTTQPETPSSPTSEPTKTGAPSPKVILDQGDKGDRVRELQARLKQLDWFPGKITGEYDKSTVDAVGGFQEKRGFAKTGTVDQVTWDKVVDMSRTPTDDEMHNRLTAGPAILKRGDKGDKVKELQARLKQLDWFSGDVTPNYGPATETAVKGFQEKRGYPATGEVDQRTWDKIVSMSRTPTKDELNNVKPKPSTKGLDSRCMTGRAMCISKTTNKLVWVVDGKAKLQVDVRFGAYETPTRNGSFQVGWKAKDWVSTIYHSPMPFSMFFSGGQAVHYSSDFAARGYNGASHGCVNVRDYDGIKWLFGQVKKGDKVIVYS